LGQGGRPALHAETASRGSEPVASPTGSEEVRLEITEISEAIEGFDAFERGPHVEALIEERALAAGEICTGDTSTRENPHQVAWGEGVGQAEGSQ
jgi:hypothetical protein